MTLDQIQAELEQGDVLPARAADLLVLVAAKYSRAADNYIVANAELAREFTTIRPQHKSDTATERALEYSDFGIAAKRWKYQLKKAEMLSKALSTLVYQRTAEAKNQM